jgi:metal-dependent amidase/aminoacylase/carboxypeptidase family protein
MESLVQLRRHLHQHPEVAFEEVETAKCLKAALVSSGFDASQFVDLAVTGFYYDILGTGAPIAEPKAIALRAEMDALRMDEANQDLAYRSVNQGRLICADMTVTALA